MCEAESEKMGLLKFIQQDVIIDVTLPCSLITKENLQLTRFTWRKNYDGQMVFQYDYGVLYSDKRPGQSEQFKGRVSHFPDELEQGNASIIIRNTTRADSGEYRCYFPLIQKPQKFYIELVVGEYFDERVKDVLSFKDWSLVSTLLSITLPENSMEFLFSKFALFVIVHKYEQCHCCQQAYLLTLVTDGYLGTIQQIDGTLVCRYLKQMI
uniref:Ig-like domain-containing protein n=1 Tax=Sander lucioperca TaxID=283035 RepID=A0A8C9XHS4_SANLU